MESSSKAAKVLAALILSAYLLILVDQLTDGAVGRFLSDVPGRLRRERVPMDPTQYEIDCLFREIRKIQDEQEKERKEGRS